MPMDPAPLSQSGLSLSVGLGVRPDFARIEPFDLRYGDAA